MTIELKNRVSPSIPTKNPITDAAAPRVEEPSFATSRQLKLPEGSQREVTVGDVSGTIYYKAPTAKQVAVVYAADRIRTALIASCLIAEGKDSDQANQLAASALGACYHGGNGEFEKLGIKAPAIILSAEERDGGIIAHEIRHARGGSESEARTAQKEYLARRGVSAVKIEELAAIDPRIYPDPTIAPNKAGKIISLSIGPVGGGGGGWGNYRPPPVNRKPVTPVTPVPKPKEISPSQPFRLEGLGRPRNDSKPPPKPPSLQEDLARMSGAALAAAAAVTREVAAQISRVFGRTPPPSSTEGEQGVTQVSGSLMGSSTQGGSRRGRSEQGRGDRGHRNSDPRAKQTNPKTKDSEKDNK